jgi:prevent-host-death family protein
METFVTAAELRGNLFRIIDQVESTHDAVIVTKHGKPVVKIVHLENAVKKNPLLGALVGGITEHGDLTQPACDAMDWEATQE